jgi:tight adherence protein C
MTGVFEIALLILGGLFSIGLVLRGSWQVAGEQQLSRRLGDLSRDVAYAEDGPRARAARSMLATVLNGGTEGRAEVERDLAAAGYLSPNGALAFGAIRIGGALAIGLVLFVAMTASAAPVALRWAVPIAVAAGVFLGAKIVLRMSSARRAKKIRAELPFTLDIFVMMVESGASLDQCFRAFAGTEGRAVPIVQQSVRELVEDIQRGMPYEQALSRWADRLGVPGARELATVLRQSLNQGTELTPALREFAREFSERRIFAAREAIGRKTTQMTVAMLVLLMPALMIVLAGPAVSTIGTTISDISNS